MIKGCPEWCYNLPTRPATQQHLRTRLLQATSGVFVCALCVSGVHIDENGKRSLLNCTLPSLTQRYVYLPLTCSLPTVDGDAAMCVLYKCASMSSRSPSRVERAPPKVVARVEKYKQDCPEVTGQQIWTKLTEVKVCSESKLPLLSAIYDTL